MHGNAEDLCHLLSLSVCLYRQQCVTHPVYNSVQYVLQPGKAQKLEQALLLYSFPVNETDTTKT
jgi:hypothetical protein